jgi:hypothetical protein
MVSFREPVRSWLEEVFGTQPIEDMEEMATHEGETVFGTQYTIEDYEDDLTYHEKAMKKAEKKFEHYNDIRNDYLRKAREASHLTRKRYLAQARKKRKQAFKHIKVFVAHLERFEQKLDELTAYETHVISADENTTVDLDETAEDVNQVLTEVSEVDSIEREEADKAIEREMEDHNLDDKVRPEEEALREMEQEGVPVEKVGLDGDVDEFIDEELGEEDHTQRQHEEEGL